MENDVIIVTRANWNIVWENVRSETRILYYGFLVFSCVAIFN